MKAYWNCTKEQLEEMFGFREKGLTEEEVERIRKETGENRLNEGRHKSLLQVFLSQFCDLMVIILIIAAIISMFSGNTESTIVIFLVLLMNAVLGTIQYRKAEKSLDSLKDLAAPAARVIRDGKRQEIASKEIVPGDYVILEAGDMIVADGRILRNYSLQVNEGSLTGESANVEKNEEVLPEEVPLADRKNMVFSGSFVTYGRAEVLVTATGMETELGKIAGLMNQTKERKTPLQISLDSFSKKLAILIMAICALVFCLGIYRKMPVIDAMMFAVALAVAAIPEALGSIVTIVQAMGSRRMAKEHAIVKELKAVESLGCVSVICSDKTGTLTQNKMHVEEVYLNGMTCKPDELTLESSLQRLFLYNAILNNDASITDGKVLGDPTESALLEMFHEVRLNQDRTENVGQLTIQEETIRNMIPRLEEIPFDSERKCMSSKYRLHGEEEIIFTKGAVDVLLNRCINVAYEEEIRPMDNVEIAKIQKQNQHFSENGLRVLAFACKKSGGELTVEKENGLTFLGLAAMADPPREESIQAVADAKRAGIRTIMITGDHKITAVAIAKRIGIYEEGDLALTGTELDACPEKELEEKIDKISVYARVSPEHKIRIVKAWQKRGNIVSMTGDGVNDAPALKQADIGVAMGITGTEVAKDAAAMILTDDNFATIIKAVTNGRNIYRNIKNAILFLLSGNMAGILSVLYTSLLGLPVPFAPVHLLFINLLTDSLPAIAIGVEPQDASLLEEKPRQASEGILSGETFRRIMLQGLCIAASTMAAFYIGNGKGAAMASTMAFATLTLARLFHGFNCRGNKTIFALGFTGNPYSILAFVSGSVLLGLVLFVPPLRGLFSVESLSCPAVIEIILLAALPTVVIQMVRGVRELKK